MSVLPSLDRLSPNFEGPTDDVIERLRPVLRGMALYHRHQVVGLDHIPRQGRALLAVHHSLATYDGLLLGRRILEDLGRTPTALGDNRLFQTPGLRRLVHKAGIVPASHGNGEELLRREHLVLVAPGGMREALRPSTERYQIRWEKRRGFVRLAVRTGAPILLAACPAADDLYTVYETPLTKVAYKAFHVPVPLVRGLGLSLVPRPVQLTHYVSEPVSVPRVAPDDPSFDAVVEDVHARVVEAMEALLQAHPGHER